MGCHVHSTLLTVFLKTLLRTIRSLAISCVMRLIVVLLSYLVASSAFAYGADLSQRLERLLRNPTTASYLANAGGFQEVVSFEAGLIIRYGKKEKPCVGKIVVEPESGNDQFLPDPNCSSNLMLSEAVREANGQALAAEVKNLKGAIRYVQSLSTMSRPVYEVVAARREGRGLILGYRPVEFSANLCWVSLEPTGYKSPNIYWRPSSSIACENQ